MSNRPSGLVCDSWVTIIPPIKAAIPPAICCSDEFILIKAPRSFISGIEAASACDGTMRAMIPIIITTFTRIKTNKDTCGRWV